MAPGSQTPGRRGRRAPLLAIAIALALTAPALHARPDPGGGGSTGAQEAQLQRAVLDLLEAPGGDDELLLSEFTTLGPEATALCFELLIDGPLTSGGRARARRALSLVEADAIWAQLALHATGSPSDAVQSLGVELLEERGTGDQFALLCQLVEPRGEEHEELSSALAQAVELALTGILLRDEDSYSILEYRFARSHPALWLPIVRGIGGARTMQALELLPYLLTGDDALDALVLNQIALVSAERRRPTSEDTRTRVRRRLNSLTDPRATRQAVLAAAFLEDHDAVPILVELLDHDDEMLARDAHWALGRLTGLGFRRDSRRWRAWLEEELDFWDLRADELFDLIDRGEFKPARLALSELSDRRGFRHELATEVALALERPEELLVLQALNALEKLDSLVVLDSLIELVDDARQPVADEARRVLISLTGEDHGEQPAAWREAYSGGR